MTDTQGRDFAQRLGAGLLSFPVTTFDASGDVDERHYREHLEWLSSYPVAGLFAAGGTGEFFSLTLNEVHTVVDLAVEGAGGAVPILAPAGGATRTAIEHVRIAETTGAQGILLFPPYLTEVNQKGLVEHVSAIAAATTLPIILYGRANGVPTPETLARLADSVPNLIGYKDGIGDLELMTRIVAAIGDRLLYIGGLPTAETYALPYIELGVTTYSSAMFNFVPDFALRFYADVRAHDRVSVTRKLNEFVLPYINIRDQGRGYAVSIVKAGLDAIGRYGGPVRPPLSDLRASEREALSALIAQAATVPA